MNRFSNSSTAALVKKWNGFILPESINFSQEIWSMYFRFHSLRSAKAAVRLNRPDRKVMPVSNDRIRMFTVQKLRDLIEKKKHEGSISEVIRVLATAEQEGFLLDREALKPSLTELVRRVFTQSDEKLGAGPLTTVIDHASSLGAITNGQVGEAFKLVKAGCEESSDQSDVHEWEKSGLALWSASLWHGFSTVRFHKLCLRLLSREDSLRWSIAVRLAWCVMSDPVTKMDPALVSKVEGIVNGHLVEKSLKELAQLANSKLYSAESSVVRKAALLAIAQRATSETAIKEDNRIPSQLLSAWTEQRSMPANTELFGKVFSQCVRSGLNPHLLLEAVATLNLSSMVDMNLLRETVFGNEGWKPSLEQLTSLCASFSALGFNDIEATSFLAHHLDQVFIHRDPDYFLPVRLADMWKIGVWYSFVTATASETTAAAFLDSYRELSKKIASGMWDSGGEFVAKQLTATPPNVRAMRMVISQSLSSLGISNMQNVHLVNTPYVASLYLPDREGGGMVLSLVQEKDCIGQGGFVGEVHAMNTIVNAKGIKCKLVPVTEWEQKHASLSQDEFLAAVLQLIQHNSLFGISND